MFKPLSPPLRICAYGSICVVSRAKWYLHDNRATIGAKIEADKLRCWAQTPVALVCGLNGLCDRALRNAIGRNRFQSARSLYEYEYTLIRADKKVLWEELVCVLT